MVTMVLKLFNAANHFLALFGLIFFAAMNYTGHCVDKFFGRPSTVPKPSLGRDSIDDVKRSWDKIRFGEQTKNFKDVEGRYSLHLLKSDRVNGVHHCTYRDNSKTHPLIKFENQVLEYSAVYEEIIRTEDGSHIEPHDCLLRYYVEDGTLDVIEKPVPNSGRTEFRLIKRTRVPKPGMDCYYSPSDLYAGNRILAYGMTFHIIHGTAFAEDFTSKRFGLKIETFRPGTTHAQLLQDVRERPGSASTSTDLMSTHKERVASFLTQQDFSQQVDNICLDVVWDDTDSLYGEVHELKLKYYLLDDTADVFLVEAKKFETKYSGPRIIVKRQKLQKETDLSAPLQGLDSRMRLSRGNGTDQTIASKQQYIDCNAPGSFYHWSELLPGTCITILGRKAQVVGFGNKRSEQFFEKMLGATLVQDLGSKFRFETSREVPFYEHVVPEYSGYGSYEDSMRSVKSIAPQAPPSKSGNSHALRFKLQFKAKMLSSVLSDENREFIVSFFCEDGTITVFESSARNSGRASYTFASRSKFIKSSELSRPGSEPEYYGTRDLHVGSILVINGHHFELTEAAPGTQTFMDAHSAIF